MKNIRTDLAHLYNMNRQDQINAIEFTLELLEEIQDHTDENKQPIAYSKQKQTIETLHRLRHELF